MTAKRALALFQNTSGWLLAAVEQGRTCNCGACFLCAYRFFEKAESFIEHLTAELLTHQRALGAADRRIAELVQELQRGAKE
jgi:hypothetical protein